MSNINIKNLVYSGSGSLLPAFSGATDELFKNIDKSKIRHICGTSGGSIYAFLLIIFGMDTGKTQRFLLDLNFKDFFDNSFGWFRDTWRLITKGGWNKGEQVIETLHKVLKDETGMSDITFYQLYRYTGINFNVVVTNAETSEAIYCNFKNTPGLSVIESVRRSMSIPLVFTPRKDKHGTYIDGGVCDNFAITLFDSYEDPSCTVGFRLRENKGGVKREKVKGMLGMIRAVRRCWLRPQSDNDNSGVDRIIYIYDGGKSGIDPLDKSEKLSLITNGRHAVQRWLAKKDLIKI